MQLFQNASQDGNEHTKDAAMSVMKQDEIFQEEKSDPRYSYNDSLDEAPAQRSWSRAIIIYRDFVLSAFTDGYSTVSHGMLVVCFLDGKTCFTQLVRPRVQYHIISNFLIVPLIGILL
jgi:hypothetical protein